MTQLVALFIGLPSLLARLFMLFVFAALALAVATGFWRVGRRRTALFASLLPLGASAAIATQLVWNASDLRTLRKLSPEKLRVVVVGGQEIHDAVAFRELAACLETATWFDGRHGLAVPLELIQTDGSRWRRNVVAVGEGAVIDFGTFRGEGGIYRGAAYSECLPDVLRRSGVRLTK